VIGLHTMLKIVKMGITSINVSNVSRKSEDVAALWILTAFESLLASYLSKYATSACQEQYRVCIASQNANQRIGCTSLNKKWCSIAFMNESIVLWINELLYRLIRQVNVVQYWHRQHPNIVNNFRCSVYMRMFFTVKNLLATRTAECWIY